MRCVMATLEKYAKKENCYLGDNVLWIGEYTNNMWESTGEKYLISRFCGHNQNEDMSWKNCRTKYSN